MARRLTTFSKFLIVLVVVAAAYFGIQYLLNSGVVDGLTNNSSSDTKKTEKPKLPRGVDADDVINVGVVTWGGYAGGQYFNKGFEANKESRFYKDYGLLVDFKVLDDFEASRNAFRAGRSGFTLANYRCFPYRSEWPQHG